MLLPHPYTTNMIKCIWLFRPKTNVDGSLFRYKDQILANGRSQIHGIDCDETFSLVVKPTTIHIVLIIVVTHKWPIR